MENNGRGIFYGVIGVATLVVAIIGATFAYFSAATGTKQNVTAGGAVISLDWREDLNGLRSDLVPVETGFLTGTDVDGQPVTQTASAVSAAAEAFKTSPDIGITDCKDQNGNFVCSVYEFEVINPSSSTADQRLYASFTTNNSVQNLKFAIFKGTTEQIKAKAGFDVNGTAKSTTAVDNGELVVATTDVPAGATSPQEHTFQLQNLSELLGKGKSTTYTMIVWIEEVGATQKQGGSFTGKVNFTTESDGKGVTGVLGTSGN